MYIKILNDLNTQEMEIIKNNDFFKKKKNTYIDYKNKVCLKPWGHEFLIYESNHISIWMLSINQNHKTSLHTHFNKDTTLIVLNGCVKLNLIDDQIMLPIMNIVNIPKYKFHGIEALTTNTILLEIEIFSKDVAFSDKNDVLRIDDIYDREKTGYESSINISTDFEAFDYIYLTENFHNQTFKVFNPSTCLHKICNSNIYILLDGIINNNGLYIHEGSIVPHTILHNCTNDVLILEISKPYAEEDAKIIHNLEQLKLIIDEHKNQNIILTSGCFDIMHVGHMHFLKNAKLLGDKLFVCLSSDKQIKALKGADRPINNYNYRIQLFKTIQYVDYIILYDESDINNESTLDKIMNIVKPLYWVKGTDYDKNDIIKKHPTVNVQLIENVPHISTTQIISNINKQ